MKKILLIFGLIFLLFFSTLKAWSDVGDVYYCEMTNFLSIKNHQLLNHKLEKFNFTRDTNKIILNSSYYFDNYSMNVEWSTENLFSGSKGSYSLFSYEDGNFIYSRSDFNEATMISATCSIF